MFVHGVSTATQIIRVISPPRTSRLMLHAVNDVVAARDTHNPHCFSLCMLISVYRPLADIVVSVIVLSSHLSSLRLYFSCSWHAHALRLERLCVEGDVLRGERRDLRGCQCINKREDHRSDWRAMIPFFTLWIALGDPSAGDLRTPLSAPPRSNGVMMSKQRVPIGRSRTRQGHGTVDEHTRHSQSNKNDRNPSAV
jgi:hypothetical protein